jgi:hypothetical protein
VDLRSWWKSGCVDSGKSLVRHGGGCGEVCNTIYEVVPQRDRSDLHEMRHLFYVSSMRAGGGAGADVPHRLSGEAFLLLYDGGTNACIVAWRIVNIACT